jgi:mannose-6-phosphate isomerase-like protein (cupin superfamily)
MKTKPAFLARKAPASPTLLQGEPGGDEVRPSGLANACPRRQSQLKQAEHLLDAGIDAGHGLMTSVTEPAEWLTDIERFHGEWEGGDYGTDICVIANHIDGPGRRPKLHKHPYPETFVIRSGRGLFTVGDRKIEARTEQILVVPANTPHKFENLGPGRSTR